MEYLYSFVFVGVIKLYGWFWEFGIESIKSKIMYSILLN